VKIVANFNTDPVDIWAYTEKDPQKGMASALETYERVRNFVNAFGKDSRAESELGIFHPYPETRFVIDHTDGSFDADKAKEVSYLKAEQAGAYKMSVYTEGTLWLYMLSNRGRMLFHLLEAILKEMGVPVTFKKGTNDATLPGGEKIGMGTQFWTNGATAYEDFTLTFDYDDAYFRKALPDPFYGRDYHEGKGITGLGNAVKGFEVNEFVKRLIDAADRI